MNQRSVTAIIGFLLLLPCATAAAQEPPDLQQALVRVAPDETVSVLDTNGQRLAGAKRFAPSG